MRNNIYLISILIFVINACNALTSVTIKSTKTIPTSNSSSSSDTYPVKTLVPPTKSVLTTTINNSKQLEQFGKDGYTTVIRANYSPDRTFVLPDNVASVFMTCFPPKGLQKRTITTKSIPSKTIPDITTQATTITRTSIPKTPSSSTTTNTKIVSITKTTSTFAPWVDYARNIERMTTYGSYSLYQRFGGMTVCNVFTLKYPITTSTRLTTLATTYKPFSTYIKYPAEVGGEKTVRSVLETTSYGYTASVTGISVPFVQTARSHELDNVSITCSTSETYVSDIPYISTKSYETPIATESTLYNYLSQVRDVITYYKSLEYVKLYSAGTITNTFCDLSYKTTKQPPPIITTTTTTTTKQPPVIATTTTTTTKQLPVITTTTTTTTTKQLPVTTTTTTTTKQLPITTKCLPITITVTEKEKITVTEKETVTVTIKSEPTNKVSCAKKWGQCGGVGFSGPTCCESGSICKEHNQYYSQCI